MTNPRLAPVVYRRLAFLKDRLHLQRSGMRRADQKTWFEPNTLVELGDVVARWLQRDGVESHPGIVAGYGPDPETVDPLDDYQAGLVPVLTRANRAGFVTNCSQPGLPLGPGFDNAMWQQRAFVTGFASRDLATDLHGLALEHGLFVAHHVPPHPRWRWQTTGCDLIAVTERAGRCTTSTGWQPDRNWIRDWTGYLECNDTMLDVLCGSDWVSLVDPEYGRNTLLWPALDALVASRTR